MRKYINVLSVLNIIENSKNNNKLKESFLRYSDNDYNVRSTNNLSIEELHGFVQLFMQIKEELDFEQLDGYFFNSSFEKGIREQFDILRFSENRRLYLRG